MTSLAQSKRTGIAAYIPVALCCLAAVSEGLDLQIPGVSAPVLTQVFDMSPDQTGLFLSLSTFGMMIGALVGGRLSDSIGRKWVLIASITIYSIFTILTTFSSTTGTLFWLRFFTGIGLGGALPNLFALAVESVPKGRRSLAVGLVLAGPGIGGALAGTVAAVAATPEQWQMLYYVGGLLPMVIVVPLLIFFLPNYRSDANSEANRDLATKEMPGMKTVLFGGGRAMLTLAVWIGLLTVLLVLFILLSWLPTLMVDRGLTGPQASTVQVALNLFAIPGSILAGMTMDYILRQGKFLLLIGVFIGAMASIALLATGPVSFGLMFIGAALAGLTVIGAQTMIYALAPICYPRLGRGTGVGFSVAIGRFGSAGGPLITGYLVAFGLTSANILMALLPVTAVSGAAALYIVRSVRSKDAKDNADQ